MNTFSKAFDEDGAITWNCKSESAAIGLESSRRKGNGRNRSNLKKSYIFTGMI